MSNRFKHKSGSTDQSIVFVKPADLSRANFTGILVEGEFVESLPNQYDDSKLDFKIIADTKTKIVGVDKDEDRYEREIGEGTTVVVNGAGNLNFVMKNVGPGDLCQIAYNGKVVIQGGPRKGKEAHNFEVAYGAE
jgi:hypothetical protein